MFTASSGRLLASAHWSHLLGLAAAVGVAVAGGCAGHGKYTTAEISLAKQKMGAMKAATEWDMAHQSFQGGDLDKAMRHVDNSILYNDKVPKSFVLRGRILIEKGELEQAADSLAAAEELDAQNVDANYYQGIICERFVKPEEALPRYLKAAELDPSDPQYALAASEVMVDLDRLDEAKTYLTERAEKFPHNAGVRQTLGHIAMMQDRDGDAAAMFHEAHLLAPDDTGILEDLVRAEVNTGQYAEAEYNLSALLENRECAGRRDLRHLRARCLIEVNRPLEARQILIGLTTGAAGQADAEAWIDLGNVAYALNDRIRVRQAADRAVAIAPDRPEGHMLRALQLRREGDFRNALASAQRALAIAKTADAHILAGLIQQDLRMQDQAKASYRAALAVDEGNETAATLLAAADGIAGVTAEQ